MLNSPNNRRLERSGRLLPRNIKEIAQALLMAGLPTSMVVFALSSNADLPQGSQQTHLRSDTRRRAQVVLTKNSETRPVATPPRSESHARQSIATDDVSPHLEGSVGVVISRNPVLSEDVLRVNATGGTQSAAVDPSFASGSADGHVEAERLTPQQVVRAIDAELARNPANATQVTNMLDSMATSSEPKALKAAVDRVLQALDDPRQRWSADGDSDLLTQGLRNLLGRIRDDRVRVFSRSSNQPIPDLDAYTEQDFQRQQQRIDHLRSQALVTLSQQRIDELLAQVSTEPTCRYDGVLRRTDLLNSVVYDVGLLCGNADAATSALAVTRVRCLLIDMGADMSRDPARSDVAAKLAAMLVELDGLARR